MIYLIILLLPFSSLANINVIDVKINQNPNGFSTLYFNLINDSDKTEYITGFKINNQETPIYKTIIDKNISKIIKINKLALPAKAVTQFKPFGLFTKINYKNNDPLEISIIYF